MTCHGALRPGRVHAAARLALEVPIPADVIGVRVGVADGRQMPAVLVQDLPDLAARVLVAAAVNETHVRIVQPHQPRLGGTLHVIAAAGHLYQFVHGRTLLPHFPTL